MGFSAVRAVERLDFDFRPLVDAHGTIPEPSHDLRDRFLDRLDRSFTGDGSLAARVEDMSVADMHKMEGEMQAAIAELCQGTPPAETIAELPPRHQYAFMGWIAGQLAPDPTRADTSG